MKNISERRRSDYNTNHSKVPGQIYFMIPIVIKVFILLLVLL